MQRDGSTLAKVHLCFVFVLSLMLQPAAKRGCSPDATHQVESLLNKTSHLSHKCSLCKLIPIWSLFRITQMQLDCRLYTPTVPAFEQKCRGATMKCFIDEIRVLVEEWGSPFPISSNRLIKTLEGLRRSFKEPKSECYQCELFDKKNATYFLEDLLSTLIMLNNDYCPKKKKKCPAPVSSS